jgi:hypothetical protein
MAWVGFELSVHFETTGQTGGVHTSNATSDLLLYCLLLIAPILWLYPCRHTLVGASCL